jgi:transcriptional regulator with XRE-family HTH domain
MLKELPQMLDAHRKKSGVTYTELGTATGLHRRHISRTLRGENNVSLEYLSRVAHALGVRVRCEIIEAPEGARRES